MAKKKSPNESSEEQILQPEDGGDAPKSKKEKAQEKAEEKPVEVKKPKEHAGFNAFMSAAKKKWGDNVARASDIAKAGVQRISFGNIGLDIATFGGCPMGRIIRLWGQQKSAKTGSAFNLVAEWQKHCSICFKREECGCKNRDKAAALWVDAEGRSADNMPWMQAHGIDMDKLFIMQPATGEQVVDCIDAALRDAESGIGLIVLDSIAHVVSSSELDKATEDGEVIGRNAKLINSALRKWTSALTARGLMAKAKPTLVLLNQIRSKVDMWGGDTMPGGKGLDFATSLDIKFTKKALHYLINEGTEEAPEWVDKVASGAPGSYKPKADEQPDYIEIEYKVTESSVCPKGRYGIFNYWLRPTHGHRNGDPDNGERIFDYAKSYGLLRKEGGQYALKTLRGSTHDSVKQALIENKEVQAELWSELLTMLTKS